MRDTDYFISDLHLDSARPSHYTVFFDFLMQIAPHAKTLYILGDLFDFWIGDDDLDSPLNQQLAKSLSALAIEGTQLFYMRGNHDFLPGNRFAKACNLIFLPDPTVISIAGQNLLLSHGDLFCTDDKSYLMLRKILHNRMVQSVFLALPKSWRRYIAGAVKSKSQDHAKRKSLSVLDVNKKAVQHAMRITQSNMMIHGHTHRPAKHTCKNSGSIRWVLPNWSAGKEGYLCIKHTDISLMHLDHTPFSL